MNTLEKIIEHLGQIEDSIAAAILEDPDDYDIDLDDFKPDFNQDDVILLVDGNNGIYAGKVLAERYGESIEDLDPDDLASLLAGPDDDNYLEAQQNTDDLILELDGKRYRIVPREGDIFAVPEDMDLPEDWF